MQLLNKKWFKLVDNGFIEKSPLFYSIEKKEYKNHRTSLN